MYDPCFAPASQIEGLRLLAVRVDPPEVLYDPATLATEGPVSVRALVAYPLPSTDAVTLQARVCGRAVDGRCGADVPWIAASRGDQFLLPEVAFGLPAAAIAEARDADALAGYGGVRVTIEVEAKGVDGIAVTGSKVIVASPRREGYVPNHALELRGVTVVHQSGREEVVLPGKLLRLDVGESAGLYPRLAPGLGATDAAEEYDTVDLAGRAVRLRERVSYSFFVTPHAQFGPVGRPLPGADEADEPAPGDPLPAGGLVRLSALYESAGRAFIVARDGRGGEAFMAIDLELTDRRSCLRGDLPTKCASLEIGCQ